MARHKQTAPLRREPSDFESVNGHALSSDDKSVNGTSSNGAIVNSAVAVVKEAAREPPKSQSQEQAGLTQLIICVVGIYVSL